ncbi:hypothetical protein AcW1_008989 [Taiwanofungus camphoratus]|nr:hypothetical protein AcV5_007016 [Antrodia cinnamomea]KAI0949355.1 hypothetical protein AcW1_008989 [Antrodia cinnamomea]KAI0958833.1 hypothetical protein AcV7_004538 [Antrodia cinnamomea]
MSIRPKWLKDLCSVLFAGYYIIYANEADEKLRKFRAVPTVEMLRTTWEKTSNPYLRLLTYYPKVTIRRKVLLPRPGGSTYTRPISAWLFFSPPEHHLARATNLILDFPGGGFISMTPEHHEDRLRMWAERTGKPVLAIEYGKAPEYPYPYAIDECFDAYRVLVETSGKLVGMSGHRFRVIVTGDSAGAHIATGVMLKILETQFVLPHPVALVLNYACLDFNFTSWMSPANLRVLQSEQSSGHIPGLAEQKDHYSHISPLSMVGSRKILRRRRSWRDAIRTLASPTAEKPLRTRRSTPAIKSAKSDRADPRGQHGDSVTVMDEEAGDMADAEDSADPNLVSEEEKSIEARVRFRPEVEQRVAEKQEKDVQAEPQGTPKERVPLGTRLTMTSRTGYFQDRIISPSMMRAMAILYIGPHRNPDFSSDYYISPILAPSHLLAQFPPLLMSCGEKDPFVDDTVIFAGRIREAKRVRKQELDVSISGKSVKFGEQLRMSAREDEATRALRRERDQLAAQGEEDWVTMQIFSEWSHGYLQMPMLMQEARTVINDLADWMDDAFSKKDLGLTSRRDATERANRWVGGKRPSPPRRDITSVLPVEDGSATSVTSETEMETETDDLLTFSTKKKTTPTQSLYDPKVIDSGMSFTKKSSPNRVAQSKSPEREDIASSEGLPATHHLDLLHNARPLSRLQDVPTVQKSNRRDLSPGFLTRAGKAGQTISESELMRRRRLLDSHLISSDSVGH